ncbi:MAG: cytochrome c [Chitinophagaceae bacterium]|nr:MAG: cytochrome c [Chitinophagaceae bacterium]
MKIIAILVSGFVLCSAFTPSPYNIVQKDKLTESIARGKVIYVERCMSCHQEKGEGLEGNFPPLAKADFLTKSLDRSIYAVKFGMEGKITVNGKEYDNLMPNPGLENNEVADVMNYIRNAWGNTSSKKIVTEEMVKAIQEKK